ncbi:hypothetical protein [Bacillus sp. CDB3]|uniref:hypothetical protein n=1 Tax=Bacillus sp. CDB3 TaxID=360310 RepID=UPI0009D81246|nr:hypothetical protein [Bacillus sp. CDB3]OQR53160.1 hypothetical protein CDB3_31675 [Bacillus sp. CDB3]
MENNKLNRAFRIGINIVLGLLFLGAVQMFFDKDQTNDHFGYVFLVAAWMVNSVKQFTINVKEGDKKDVLFWLSAMIISFFILGYMLFTYARDYFSYLI